MKNKSKKKIKNNLRLTAKKDVFMDKVTQRFYDEEVKKSKKLYADFSVNLTRKRTGRDFMNKIKKDFDATVIHCMYCGVNMKGKNNTGTKKDSGVCQSHNIPNFVLQNIVGSVKGGKKVATISTIGNRTLTEEYLGAKVCDIFKLICRDCDSKIFSLYENPDTLINLESKSDKVLQNILEKIALKTEFIDYYEFNIKGVFTPNFKYLNKQLEVRLKNSLKNKSRYKLLYSKKLNYNTGFAVQTKLAPETLTKDIKIRQKISAISKDGCYLYFCVYPVGDSTQVLIFIDENKRNIYSKYTNYLMTEEDSVILKNMSYNILQYVEGIYYNPDIFPKDLWSKNDVLLVNNVFSDVYYTRNVAVSVSNYGNYLNLSGVNEDTVTNLFEVNDPNLLGYKGAMVKNYKQNQLKYPQYHPHKFLKDRNITNYYDLLNYLRDMHEIDNSHLNYILHQPLIPKYNQEYKAYAKRKNMTKLEASKMFTNEPRLMLDYKPSVKYKVFLMDLLYFVDNDYNLFESNSFLLNLYLYRYGLRLDRFLFYLIQNEKGKAVPKYPAIKQEYLHEESYTLSNDIHILCIKRLLGSKYIKVSW